MAIQLYPHQEKAVKNMKNGCVLVGDVGSGKSITSVAYYKQNHFPKDVYVITTPKKRDSLEWEEEFANIAITRDAAKSYKGVTLTIDSWNNIHKYMGVTGAFFIFDEQRLVGNGTWVKSFLKIVKGNHWILLSGTPGDTYMEYVPLFLAHGFFKNRSEFIRNHVVYSRYSKFPKVERYVDTAVLDKMRRYILVEMPFVRHTTRHQKHILVDYDKDLFNRAWVDRWHVFEERPIRDIAELFIVIRKIANTHDSRIEKVLEIAKDHPRLIIFYNFNYELEKLRTLGEKLDIPIAEWNGHKHEKIPDTDRWVYLVQYTAGAEGWNCVSTDTVIFYSLNYSYKIFEQAQGRIDRLNTKYTDLYYYIFRSGALIDKAIWKALSVKKDFNKKNLRKEL